MLLLQNLFCRVRLDMALFPGWTNQEGDKHTQCNIWRHQDEPINHSETRLAPGAMKPFKYLEHSSDPNKPSKRLDITLQLKKIQVVRAPQLLIATKVAWDRGNNEIFKALRCITNFDKRPWLMLPSGVWLRPCKKTVVGGISTWEQKNNQKEGFGSD